MVAKKLFGLQFIQTDVIDTYHNEVMTYKVEDSEHNLVAIFYADFFPRAGKRNGAWMTSFKSQYVKNNTTKDHTYPSFVISLNRRQPNHLY